MKGFICLQILFCLLCTPAAGQENSIFFAIPPGITKTNPDSAYISRLIRRGGEVKGTDFDSAMALYRQALSISRDAGYAQGIARSLLYMGVSLLNVRKQYKESKALYLEAIPYCYLAAKEDPSLLPFAYECLAIAYSYESYYDSAFHLYYKALSEINKSGKVDSVRLLSVYANLGATFVATGQDGQALFYLRKATWLAEQRNDSVHLAQSYFNMANLYSDISKDSAVSVSLDSARYYWDAAILRYKWLSDTGEIQRVYTFIGASYLIRKKREEGLKYFRAAMAADPAGAATNLHLQQALGGVYHEAGNYQKAIPYFKQVLALCRRYGMRQPMLHAYWSLADSYDKTGNGHLAFIYQREYSFLTDSLMNEHMVKSINSMEVKYRTREKDKMLVQQDLLLHYKESKLREKNLWIGGIALSGFLFILLLANVFRHRQRSQKEKMVIMERDREVERLHAIMEAEEQERNRIARDLHDGVGVLLSAAMMNYTVLGKKSNPLPPLAEDAYREGLEILQEMQKEIRVIAHNLVPDVAARQSLAEAVQTLVKRIGQSRDIKIGLRMYGRVATLEPERSLSVYRMLEELIQNVIKHADATELQIQLLFHEEQLHIVVEDNGNGFDTEQASGGMGLQNLYSRAEKLNGHLSILSGKGSGTTVAFEVPYHKGGAIREPEAENNDEKTA